MSADAIAVPVDEWLRRYRTGRDIECPHGCLDRASDTGTRTFPTLHKLEEHLQKTHSSSIAAIRMQIHDDVAQAAQRNARLVAVADAAGVPNAAERRAERQQRGAALADADGQFRCHDPGCPYPEDQRGPWRLASQLSGHRAWHNRRRTGPRPRIVAADAADPDGQWRCHDRDCPFPEGARGPWLSRAQLNQHRAHHARRRAKEEQMATTTDEDRIQAHLDDPSAEPHVEREEHGRRTGRRHIPGHDHASAIGMTTDAMSDAVAHGAAVPHAEPHVGVRAGAEHLVAHAEAVKAGYAEDARRRDDPEWEESPVKPPLPEGFYADEEVRIDSSLGDLRGFRQTTTATASIPPEVGPDDEVHLMGEAEQQSAWATPEAMADVRRQIRETGKAEWPTGDSPPDPETITVPVTEPAAEATSTRTDDEAILRAADGLTPQQRAAAHLADPTVRQHSTWELHGEGTDVVGWIANHRHEPSQEPPFPTGHHAGNAVDFLASTWQIGEARDLPDPLTGLQLRYVDSLQRRLDALLATIGEGEADLHDKTDRDAAVERLADRLERILGLADGLR